jgi:hypothetical protein
MNRVLLRTIVLLTVAATTACLEEESGEFVTYESPDYGIRITHPDNWIVKESESKIQITPRWKVFDPYPENLAIGIVEFSPPVNLDELSELVTEALTTRSSDVNIIEAYETTLSNRPAYRVVYSDVVLREGIRYNIKAIQLWVIKNEEIYVVSYYAEADEYTDFVNIIEEMISTVETL